MQIFYRCTCMSTEQPLDVPTPRPGADPELWLEIATNCVSYDHYVMNQTCPSGTVIHMKVPAGVLDEGTTVVVH